MITSKLLMSVSCFKHDYANLTTIQAINNNNNNNNNNGTCIALISKIHGASQ